MSAVPQADAARAAARQDRDGVVTLTLNRPQQINLLTSEMLAALQAALRPIAGDPSVRVVVLAATGKGFCAGHDLKEIRALKRAAEDRAAVRAVQPHDADASRSCRSR